MAKKLCLKRYYGNDGSLEVFLACKPMPLNKNPAVKLIGIAEDIRRILCWAVMTTFGKKKSTGQLCASQHAGFKAAGHACSKFSEDDSNVILLVHADNAFNRINRNIMLQYDLFNNYNMYIINSVKKLGSTCQKMRRLHRLKVLHKAIQLLCLFMGFDLLVY